MDIINLDISINESILAFICSVTAAIVTSYVEKKLKSKNKNDNLIEKMFDRDDKLISDLLDQNKQLRSENKEFSDEIDELQEKINVVTKCDNKVDNKD